LFFVQVVDGGGYSTAVRLFNPTNLTAIGVLRFFTQTGSPRPLPIVGMGSVSSIPISLAAGRTVVYETTGASTPLSVGMVRLDTSVPVGGLATLFFGLTHVGVPASSVMRSGRIAVDTSGGNTGVALATSGPNDVNLKLTLQDRDGLTPQVSTPPELTPLRVNQQYARYVTEMGFASAGNLKESSLLAEPVGPGTFAPLALLDRGAFSSTATSRQRLFNPDVFVGTYTGPWTVPDFGFTNAMTLALTVAGNNATLNISFGTESFPPLSGTFNSDGELIINGVSAFEQVINFRIRADGSFSILMINLGHTLFTPTGEVRWITAFGEFAAPRVAGSIVIGHLDGRMAIGSFNLSK